MRYEETHSGQPNAHLTWALPQVPELPPEDSAQVRTRLGCSIFGDFAGLLLHNGYSPLPTEPNSKRPLRALSNWDRLRSTPLSLDEIAAVVERYPSAGIGVVGGFSGLVPLDIDTEDDAIIAAIMTALPPPLVGKRGRRGMTLFYRSAEPISARKLRQTDGVPMVEILTTGQTVIPPTRHPETGLPYEWLSDDLTLFTCPIEELPEITADHMAVVETALARWMATRREYVVPCPSTAGRVSPTRMHAYAQAALDAEANILRGMPKESGRNRQLFNAGCKLGRYVHHRVLTSTEVEDALLEACNTNGLIREDGLRACRASLASGLRKAEGDELPTLVDRPHVHANGQAHRLETDRPNSLSNAYSEDDEPLPLVRQLPPAEAYPLDALGPLKEPILAIHAASQAPLAICANAVISTVALAGQAHVDVLLPTGQARPISVDMLTIALSGERKTTVDNLAVKSVKQRQSELREKYEEEFTKYVAERKAWEAQTRKIGNDKKLSYREQKEKIASLGPEPMAPLAPLLIVHEPTVEGLAKLLHEGQPSIGIFTSEGGAFIGGHGFTEDSKLRTAAILSLLWDDGSLSRVRAGDGAKAVEGKRVSMHLQAQPDVGARFFCDRILMDQGIVWRFLVAAPDSTQGRRFWQEMGVGHNSTLDTYYQKITALLQAPLPLKHGTRNELDPRALKLSAEARAFWIKVSNEIERRVGPGGDLCPISGFANKFAEHATRLAGILTLYEDPEAEEITKEVMQNGFALATYYAQTAIRLHGAAHLNAELLEAEALLQWLRERWQPVEGPLISLPELVQLGPNTTRDTRKARHLISILEHHRHLKRLPGSHEVKGKMRREVWEVKT